MNPPPESPPSDDALLRFDLNHDNRHHLPVLRIKGPLTDVGWPALAGACARLTGPVRVLDFSGVTHCETGSEDAASFGRQLGRQQAAAPEQSCHILVAPGDLLFGLCRVIQMNLDMARIKAAAFRSLTAATRWLEEENLLPDRPVA